MFCSRSVTVHVLRGLAAAALLVLALGPGLVEGWWRVVAIAGAVVLMRGCPACWLLGLIGTIASPRSVRRGAAQAGDGDATLRAPDGTPLAPAEPCRSSRRS